MSVPALHGCSARNDGDWVARAESANRDADRLLATGDTSGARAALVSAEASIRGAGNDERAVRLDLLYRLAEIDLGKSDTKSAVDWASRGLDLGRSNDTFTTNLLIVRGHAFERMGNAVAASRDYHDALVITETLLDKTLQGKTP
ncbi:MAG TPA: hypothetical protein VH062_14155 [Polyangiaceae bacterium]|jgi:predicted negative regulator of RcsB-dependent stress response|nr:hypothetical protein [Polyangiaceae bacterium]